MITWSDEVLFKQSAIQKQVPDSPGVYQILQSESYPRYKGQTQVLKIGRAEKSLRGEILNHFTRHTAANRLAGIQMFPGVTVSVRYAVLLKELASEKEAELLRQFEDEHWEVPMLNSQRGYGRNKDVHYRSSGHTV